MDQDILTATEVAQHLRIPITTLYELAQRRRIPSFKVGRHWRFKRVKLEAWIDLQENGATPKNGHNTLRRT